MNPLALALTLAGLAFALMIASDAVLAALAPAGEPAHDFSSDSAPQEEPWTGK